MAVQLSPSYLRRSYQLLCKLNSQGTTKEEAYNRTCNILYSWARLKFCRVFWDLPMDKAAFEGKRDGNELGIIYEPESYQFIMRCAHMDLKTAGRMWITDVELVENNIDILLAVRISVSSLHSCEEEVPFSQPDFINRIIDNIGISDSFQLTGQPYLLQSKEDVFDFISLIESKQRTMPVVLISQCNQISEGKYDGYMISPNQTAYDLKGTAHVFCLTTDASFYLTEAAGKQWTAFDGAVRTYYPNLSLDESDCFKHPLVTQKSIRLKDVGEHEDQDFCLHEIESYIKNYVTSQRLPWTENNCEFYLSEYQNRLSEQRNSGLESQQTVRDSYELQISQLQKQNQENLSLADSYAEDAEKYKAESEERKQQINKLKNQVEMYRFKIEELTGRQASQDVPINGDYLQIPEWIDKYFSDRLMLLPRAQRSLKDAVYENTELVYKCLDLLASKYYSYRKGLIDYDAFVSACKEVDAGLEESAAITDVAAGERGDEYYVQHKGKSQKLERHITKGNSKDRRYCLRIYFFWDDENQMVVIGDLPHHLETRGT